jgi:hypothetical protein
MFDIIMLAIPGGHERTEPECALFDRAGFRREWESTMSEESSFKVNRRNFLTGVAVAGAATTGSPADATVPATSGAREAASRLPSVLPPNAHLATAETGTPDVPPYSTEGRPGSDFMVDVIKTLDIKYLPANPASSYRAIHESLINYGKNMMPEFLTCMHEESAVGMAHGYYKIAGKPLMTLCHGTVGLQHATMNIYNAFCDRVPVILVNGNDLDAAHRPPGVPTIHSRRTSMLWCATSPNGTTHRSPRSTLPSRSCAPTR